MSEAVSRRESPGLPPGVGPRRRRSPTWAKLGSLAVTANLAGILVAIWTSRLVRGGLDDGWHETLLLFAYYSAMVLVGIVEAFFLDEVLFDGAFRLTHLQGKGGRHRADDDVHEVAATMQRSTVSFPILVLAGAFVSYLLFNAVNRDFDTYYDEVGTHVAALRDGDGARQKAAIEALSIRRRPEILPILAGQLEHDGEVAQWAAWALGRHTDLSRRRILWGPLVAASRAPDPALRREALVALGRLQHRGMAEPLQRAVTSELEGPGSVDPRLLYGLGVVQVLDSVPVLEAVLHRGSEPSQRLAAWALAQHRDQRGGRAVVSILEDRLPTASPLVRCAIVHSLGILADERSNVALIDAYDRASPTELTERCPHIEIYMRPDGKDDRLDLLLPQNTLARKIIDSMGQMRATSTDIRARVEPWLVDVVGDSPPEIAEAARSLLQGIRLQRDDRQSKSVDEALRSVR